MIERLPGEIPSFETRHESNESVDKQLRYKQIFEILLDYPEGLTAKQVAVEMLKRGFTPTAERNFSSPRLTEMSRVGIVDQIGKTKCNYTGKMVTVFKLRP